MSQPNFHACVRCGEDKRNRAVVNTFGNQTIRNGDHIDHREHKDEKTIKVL